MQILVITALSPLSFWLVVAAVAVVTVSGLLLAYSLLMRAERYSAFGLFLAMLVVDSLIILTAFPPLGEAVWKIILGQ